MSLRSVLPDVLREVSASLTVFLVALPMCVGVALASGVPAGLGLVTGIVGGLVAGALPGSTLQVSGPTAGLIAVVAGAVGTYGLGGLGILVLAAGVLQVGLGLLRCGRWFRAMPHAVVQGMLAGIGLILIAGQLYPALGRPGPGSAVDGLAGLPGLAGSLLSGAGGPVPVLIGTGTIAVLLAWRRVPDGVRRLLPGPLVAVLLATAVVTLAGLPVARISVAGLADALRPPDGDRFALLLTPGAALTVIAIALIASAESLFGSAAVDRLHHGARTDYDRELIAQGTGNLVCGALGALPMAAVVVRSAANVRAGARTRASRVLHGCWLLLSAGLLPALLGRIPAASLAAVLVFAGAGLIPVRELLALRRDHRGEAVLLTATAAGVVAVNLVAGVVLGLLLALAKSAWETSRIRIHVEENVPACDGPVLLRVTLTGHATFLRLPRLLDALEALPSGRAIELDLSGLRHVDHACATALAAWESRHNATAPTPVQVTRPGPGLMREHARREEP